tara:strand:- start:1238 stop:1963 length:726 start_codon:yes stop_codon:yes gene_type:complete
MKPEIILPYEPGRQNSDLAKANARLTTGKTYKDLSTIIVVPTRGGRSLCPRFVSAISGMMRPMNQQVFGPIFMSGMEVGAAFNSAIEMIQGNPVLAKFKYLLTVEDDNICQPDGLLKLYESIEEYDVVGGLYWTKGDGGQPMIYGDPNVSPLNFVPQGVIPETVQRCNGTGMGFALFKLSIFKKLPAPWFETKQSWDPNTGVKCYTQDLWFYEKLVKSGGKVAVDNRVKIGHLDIENDMIY